MKPFDANGAFHPAADGDGLRRLAVRGAGVTVLSQGLGFAIQTLATVILARLLTPEDFGLVTMVTTFSLLFMNFGLNGFTEAVLQREEMNHALASNLFWINVGLGVVLTIGFAAGGPLLARLYGDSRVATVAIAIALTIFFTSVSVQHLALLMRAMRFFDVSANGILARAISVALSIHLARMGLGYWALVGGTVALPLVTAAGAWTMCQWVPGLPQRGVGTRSMVLFAISIYGRFTANYFTRNMDNLLIGWRFGPQALGAYKKAYDLFLLPVAQLGPLTAVVVSALSRVARDSTQHRRYFLRALSTLAFIGMGVGAGLSLIGKDLILVLLGLRWEESGRIFSFLGPGIGVTLLYGTHGWIHLSIGRADRSLRWGVVELTVTGLLFLLLLPWGPVGIAVAWVASLSVLTIPALWYAGRPIRLGVAPLIGAVWKYLLASALAGFATVVIIREIPSLVAALGPAGAVARIVITSLLFGALYLGAVILLHRGCGPLHEVAGLLQDRRPLLRFSRSFPPVAATPGHQDVRSTQRNDCKGNKLVP